MTGIEQRTQADERGLGIELRRLTNVKQQDKDFAVKTDRDLPKSLKSQYMKFEAYTNKFECLTMRSALVNHHHQISKQQDYNTWKFAVNTGILTLRPI